MSVELALCSDSESEVPDMSRQNKVNPGMYTQRGRLAQDDAARELQRQRSVGAPRKAAKKKAKKAKTRG